MNATRIRLADAQDVGAVYDICRLTAAAGSDGTALYSDPRLPGMLYAAAYLELEPDFAFVLERDGAPVGYVIGTPDSRAFAERQRRAWWPRIREEVARMTIEGRPKDEAALAQIASPRETPAEVLDRYPAHLHINLLPQAQGGGWGRRMIEHQLDRMRAAGASGLHLGLDPANLNAARFYRHLGFEDVSVDGRVIYGMRLAD